MKRLCIGEGSRIRINIIHIAGSNAQAKRALQKLSKLSKDNSRTISPKASAYLLRCIDK